MFKIFTLLTVSSCFALAMEYKECIGTYQIDLKATIALLTSKITPENEKQLTATIDGMKKDQDKVDHVTFTLNAKSIEFMMDDGSGNVDKSVANITESTVVGDNIEITTHVTAPADSDDVSFKLYRHEKSLVLESRDMPLVLIKK